MKSITLYGLANCDTTKKAIGWLKYNQISFYFHDYKKEGITAAKLQAWANKISWETLLNKRGTTWKKISPAIQETIDNKQSAIELMQAHTSLIKRPVIEVKDKILIGFDQTIYKDNLLMHN